MTARQPIRSPSWNSCRRKWRTRRSTSRNPSVRLDGGQHSRSRCPAGTSMGHEREDHKVVIVTGGSGGIGAGVVAGYLGHGWAVVAVSRATEPHEDPLVLSVEGDIGDPATTDRIIRGTLETFGRIDTLVNNAGVFIAKPFTDYTADDYAGAVGVNLTGFFALTQRHQRDARARRRSRRQHQHAGRLRRLEYPFGSDLAHEGRRGLG